MWPFGDNDALKGSRAKAKMEEVLSGRSDSTLADLPLRRRPRWIFDLPVPQTMQMPPLLLLSAAPPMP